MNVKNYIRFGTSLKLPLTPLSISELVSHLSVEERVFIEPVHNEIVILGETKGLVMTECGHPYAADHGPICPICDETKKNLPIPINILFK